MRLLWWTLLVVVILAAPLRAQQPGWRCCPEYDAGNSSTAITLDFANHGPNIKVTRNGNTTVTLTAPNASGFVTIRFVHDGTGTAFTVAFSPAVKWPGGVAPTWTNTASAVDVLTLYYDGTNWYGVGQVSFS